MREDAECPPHRGPEGNGWGEIDAHAPYPGKLERPRRGCRVPASETPIASRAREARTMPQSLWSGHAAFALAGGRVAVDNATAAGLSRFKPLLWRLRHRSGVTSRSACALFGFPLSVLLVFDNNAPLRTSLPARHATRSAGPPLRSLEETGINGDQSGSKHSSPGQDIMDCR